MVDCVDQRILIEEGKSTEVGRNPVGNGAGDAQDIAPRLVAF